MKKIEELNQTRLITVTINKSLNKYKDKVLFPEKVAKANDALKNVGLPKSQPKPKT